MARGKPPYRLLLVGNGVGDTGYSVVLREIGRVLSRTNPVWLYGLDCKGQRRRERGINIIPNPEPIDRTGIQGLISTIIETTPDIILFCHDPWLWSPLRASLNTLKSLPVTVFYCPVDSPWNPFPRADLSGLDSVVAYTRFGANELARSGVQVRAVISHGLTEGAACEFPTSKGRKRARALLWPDRPDLSTSFLVLNANRNNLRKRIDITLKGFAAFVKQTGADSRLVLHTATQGNGIDLFNLALGLGISNHVLFTGEESRHPFFSRERLSLLYQACEVGVNTSIGEGWGLVAFEHAAGGGCQVLPDHTSNNELWRGAAFLIPAFKGDGREDHPAANGKTDPQELADALSALYNDPPLLLEVAERCRSRALEPRFNWETICGEWDAHFLRLLDERNGH